MKPTDEHRLRARVSDLVLEWFTKDTDADLDQASADDYRNLIRAAYVVSDEAGHSLSRWVDTGRHAGMSWAEIGDVLGVSRQAAQQRFSPSSIAGSPPLVEGATSEDLIVRTHMTAFNEVAALREEGEKGNELVGAAPFKLYFVPRGRPWQNIRVTSFRVSGAPLIGRYEEAGWTFALDWGPFYYFTRPADEV